MSATPTIKPKKNMTDDERAQVVTAVLALSSNGVPKKGAFIEVATKFPFTVITVRRVWHRADENTKANGTSTSTTRMKGRCGRHETDRSAALERLRAVPLTQRSTIRSAACGLPPTSLYRRLQAGLLRPAVSVVKPQLTDDNKITRLRYCIGHVDRTSRLFDEMYDGVHVNEKFFYVTEVKKRFYLLPDEDVPYRALRRRRNVTKVMFLAAVARPRWDAATGTMFGGLLGIWPFVECRPAQRSSCNRPVRTMETDNVSVGKDAYRAMLIQHVLPAICAKMPLPPHGGSITIQKDNAPPHIAPTDPQFSQAVLSSGRDVALRFQPPNSPDLNCCDLGLFSASKPASASARLAPSTS
ncbi:hypothetical protein KRP22_013126 [Phytophthora ramorum]|nr:hypothetical protein KRP22_11088 [Phytophthora ramorum]